MHLKEKTIQYNYATKYCTCRVITKLALLSKYRMMLSWMNIHLSYYYTYQTNLNFF